MSTPLRWSPALGKVRPSPKNAELGEAMAEYALHHLMGPAAHIITVFSLAHEIAGTQAPIAAPGKIATVRPEAAIMPHLKFLPDGGTGRREAERKARETPAWKRQEMQFGM